MKNLVVLITILCLLLLGGLYRCRSGAHQQAQALLQETHSFSNKLMEAQTRLVMNQALAVEAKTNLQSQVDQWRHVASSFSNRWRHAHQTVLTLQQEAQTHLAEITRLKTSGEQQETELAVLRERTAQGEFLEKQLADVKAGVAALVSERDTAQREAGYRQVQQADLERQLQDPVFLQRQLVKMKEENQREQRKAVSMVGNRPERHVPLILQPDGTVKLAPAQPESKTTSGH